MHKAIAITNWIYFDLVSFSAGKDEHGGFLFPAGAHHSKWHHFFFRCRGGLEEVKDLVGICPQFYFPGETLCPCLAIKLLQNSCSVWLCQQQCCKICVLFSKTLLILWWWRTNWKPGHFNSTPLLQAAPCPCSWWQWTILLAPCPAAWNWNYFPLQTLLVASVPGQHRIWCAAPLPPCRSMTIKRLLSVIIFFNLSIWVQQIQGTVLTTPQMMRNYPTSLKLFLGVQIPL